MAVSSFRTQKMKIGDMLVNEKAITPEQLGRALEEQRQSGKRLGEVILELGFLDEDLLVQALSNQMGVEVVHPLQMKIPEEVISLIEPSLLRRHTMIPIRMESLSVVTVAMADPMNMDALDDVTIVTGLQAEAVIASTREINLTIDKYFGNQEAVQAAEQYAAERKAQLAELEDDERNLDVLNSPVVILVNTMIEQAARQRASDIHVEALQNKVRIRYRVDGALQEKASYDIQLLPAIIARLKVIGGMDIAEKRRPQDGRITVVVDRREYDIRASVLPTVYGEKAVLRLALKTGLTRDKSELGLKAHEMKRFDHILANPNGIILVTGPTGSGKSTTLYTALAELNREDVNIVTVEDPVEANIDGINQVQVNPKAGLTFASALRSILRQDPDIIMIGEIRDAETAGIAVQASITGHLVVSTLHTNSSAATVTRLTDMGLESYLVADSVVGILAQRLVRRLCPHCRRKRLATPDEKKVMLLRNTEQDVAIYEPVGCPHCNDTGYYGRIGVYEIMEISPALKRAISKNEGTERIRDIAIQEGMHTLRMSAAEYVLSGVTSIQEMLRVSFEE